MRSRRPSRPGRQRPAFVALLLALVIACPPAGDDGDGDGPGASMRSFWLRILMHWEGSDDVWESQMLLRLETSGNCADFQAYYEGYGEAYAAYLDAYYALLAEWSEVDEYWRDLDYLRAECEIQRGWYEAQADAIRPIYGNSGTSETITPYHPDAETWGQPMDGEYESDGGYGDDDDSGYYYDDDDAEARDPVGTFSASRAVYHDNYYDWYAEQLDCENPQPPGDDDDDDDDEDEYDDSEYDALYDLFVVVEGTLVLAGIGESAFQVTLSDSVLEDEDGEAAGSMDFDARFDLCPVEWTYPQSPYYYGDDDDYYGDDDSAFAAARSARRRHPAPPALPRR